MNAQSISSIWPQLCSIVPHMTACSLRYSVLDRITLLYNNHGNLTQCCLVSPIDKRTDPWLLVYSPVPVICTFAVYLGVIWIGPKLMKDREPVNLKIVLIVYNFAMVLLSVYMFHEVKDVIMSLAERNKTDLFMF